ncbi:MAG: 16S rRNA (uracil(1498)-N(3))-methyltransferase [Steroidobacteraceae bacterium]
MRTIRLYAPTTLSTGTECLLPEEASNHALRVLRLRAGERLRLFDGAGHEFQAELLGARGKLAAVRVGDAIVVAPPSPLHITLMQGVARGERMDLVMQKATELGVARLVPVLCARSVVQLDQRQRERRHEHWHSIVVNACEQSGRSELPQLAPAQTLANALDVLKREVDTAGQPALRLTLDPEGQASFVEQITARHALVLLVGPEGGLDEMELEMARQAGFAGARLGPRILRTETAPLAALAIAQAVAGDLGGW